nr:MAG TPA: hypothetical protein [Caudoviricetes sp.]
MERNIPDRQGELLHRIQRSKPTGRFDGAPADGAERITA